jgi:hypothetical protein
MAGNGARQEGSGAARRRRAAMSVRGASSMNVDQLWNCASALHAVTILAPTAVQREKLDARAERAEGMAWDEALRSANQPPRLTITSNVRGRRQL